VARGAYDINNTGEIGVKHKKRIKSFNQVHDIIRRDQRLIHDYLITDVPCTCDPKERSNCKKCENGLIISQSYNVSANSPVWVWIEESGKDGGPVGWKHGTCVESNHKDDIVSILTTDDKLLKVRLYQVIMGNDSRSIPGPRPKALTNIEICKYWGPKGCCTACTIL